MMLADFAAAPEGKLTVVGGGWNVTGPQPCPFAIALLFEVPWHMTNQQHQFKLELIDFDGHGVVPVGGEEPVASRQRKESARTLEDARALKTKREAAVDSGEFHGRSRTTLHEYAREWVERYQGRGRRGFREGTRDDYRRILNQAR